MKNNEYKFAGTKMNGFVALLVILAITAFSIGALVQDAYAALNIAIFVVGLLVAFIMLFGLMKSVSLRARNLNADAIKVNDKTGNPIMIGLVLVWKLKDTYKALFEIDSQTMAGAAAGVATVSSRMNAFESFVRVQADAALRQVAGNYAYDTNGESSEEVTLRSGADEINEFLKQAINERLSIAGIEAVEARINYLAYAPEIAAVMLRRQQADAIISAREKIVDGAVGMVKMALDKLADEGVVELDEERKAAMVSNLLVVLCADESAQPVVNTGSLYN